MIDGVVYHVQRDMLDMTNIGFDITSADEVLYSFEWTPTVYRTQNKSLSQLIDYCKEYIKHYKFNFENWNCQHFVRDMLAYSADIDIELAGLQIILYIGTALF